MPNEPGIPSAPVFSSIDLETGDNMEHLYGLASPSGYDEEAKMISLITLGEYSIVNFDDSNKLWRLTKILGQEAGMNVNVAKIREKYSRVRRHERHDAHRDAVLYREKLHN